LEFFFTDAIKKDKGIFNRVRSIEILRLTVNLKNQVSFLETEWAGSLARLGHLLDVQKVTGSNPVRPTTKCLFALSNRS
jgi:hypothetical protein